MMDKKITLVGDIVQELYDLPRGEMIVLKHGNGLEYVIMHNQDFMEKYVRTQSKCDGNHGMPVCSDPHCWQK